MNLEMDENQVTTDKQNLTELVSIPKEGRGAWVVSQYKYK